MVIRVTDSRLLRCLRTISRCHRQDAGNPTLAIADSEGNVTLHEWNTQEVNYIHLSIHLAPIYLRVSESLRKLVLSNAQAPTLSASRWIGIIAEHPERMHVLEW